MNKMFPIIVALVYDIMMLSLSIIKGDIYFDHYLCSWHTIIDQSIFLLFLYPIQLFWMSSVITEHNTIKYPTASTRNLSTTFTEPVLEL